MDPVLEVRHLVKRYREVTAVDRVSLKIAQGCCFGLLGPNGAGKTTTIEMIEGIIRPSAGEILYKGKPPAAAFKEAVGIQFQQTALLSFLTVRETLKTFQGLYRKPRDIEALIDLCDLQEIQNRYNDRISGGQKQRLLLALALINDPELIFLDEPSTGLDPQARRNLWELVEKIKDRGHTIVLTTHYMEEAEALCDTVAVMDFGKIVAQGSPEALIRQYGGKVTVMLPRSGIEVPASQPFSSVVENGQRLEVQTEDINQCLKTLMSLGLDLADITVRSPNLERVFLNLTGRKLRE
jgi:ABC-2 type transport system ATP-binding protein